MVQLTNFASPESWANEEQAGCNRVINTVLLYLYLLLKYSPFDFIVPNRARPKQQPNLPWLRFT